MGIKTETLLCMSAIIVIVFIFSIPQEQIRITRFDRRIEVVIVPTWKSEDSTGLVPLLDRYDVGVVVLPQTGKIDNQGKMVINEILRRHIPYRFAQYGEYIHAGTISVRFMSPINA